MPRVGVFKSLAEFLTAPALRSSALPGKKLINIAVPPNPPEEKITRTWADIWMTDGVRDHSMAGYVKATAAVNANAKTKSGFGRERSAVL